MDGKEINMHSSVNKISIARVIVVLQFAMLFLSAYITIVSADGSPPRGISTDGSLGQKMNLAGPNYEIKAELGKQAGANLFHSFQQFNIHSDESATFSGPDSVQNIISRITGGDASWINGKLASEIPGADLYFLNPAGVMFGPNASLDVSGSFHVSTADYLKMGENDKFYSQSLESDILSVASPTAFGFLDAPASISIQGYGQVTEEWEGRETGLKVPEEETISLIGGEIKTSGTFYEKPSEDERYVMEISRLPLLTAPAGQINLAGVASAGEVTWKDGLPDVSLFSRLADISINEGSVLDTSGEGGGSIFIRGSDISLHLSQLFSKTLGSQDGGMVSLHGRNVFIEDYPREYSNGSLLRRYTIDTSTSDKGRGSDIDIHAEQDIFVRNSLIIAQPSHLGGYDRPSGDIGLTAENINISDSRFSIHGPREKDLRGGSLSMQAEDSINFLSADITVGDLWQNSGDALLKAETIHFDSSTLAVRGYTGSLTMQAEYIKLASASTLSGSNFFNTDTDSFDKIVLDAGELSINDGSFISVSNWGSSTGNNISIRTDKLTIAGAAAESDYFQVVGRPSGISVSHREPQPDADGNSFGGNISLETDELILKDGGVIRNEITMRNPEGSIMGGRTDIRVSGALSLSGVNNYGETDYGFGSGIYSAVTDIPNGKGPDIDIQADSLRIDNGAVITSTSQGNAAAGNIRVQIGETAEISGDSTDIELKDPLYRQEYYLQTNYPAFYNHSVSGIHTASQGQGKSGAPGGQINLSAKHLKLSDGGSISTDSRNESRAGQIDITADRLEMDGSAVISSSSLMPNIYADEVEKSGSGLLSNGDILEVSDMGNGVSGRFVYLNGQLTRTPSVYTLSAESDLSGLAEQYDLLAGDIAEFRNAQTGETIRYIYVPTAGYGTGQEWVKMDNEVNVVFNDMSELRSFLDLPTEENPFHDGQVIQLNDAGNGAPGIVVYNTDLRTAGVIRNYYRLNNFIFADMDEFREFTAMYEIRDGDIAIVGDVGNGIIERFVYDDNEWLKQEMFHTVDDMAGTHGLIKSKTGFIAQKNIDGQLRQVIYTGREWIPLGSTNRVGTLAERDALSVQNGDLVKVTDTGNGRHDAFFFVNGEWIEQKRGGDAGSISIKAGTIQLNGDSRISTESASGGGGGIELEVIDRLHLTDSRISTSVQEGVGNGGDMTIQEPEFVILDKGKIQANANEGSGGNIRIVSGQFISNPSSTVEASSQMGIDGNINIQSPDADISGSMASLPSAPLDATLWISTPCDQRTSQDISRFIIRQRDGVPPGFEDLLAVNSYQLTVNNSLITDNCSLLTEKGNFAGVIRELEEQELSIQNAVYLSDSYIALGHYRKAAEIFNAVLPMAENSDDIAGKALFYSSFGDLHLIFGDMENAILYTKKGLKLSRRIDNPLLTAGILNNLGNIRYVGTNYTGAVKAYSQALDLAEQPAVKSILLINTAQTQAAMEQYQEAAETLEKAFEQITKQPDTFNKAANLVSLYLAARIIPDHPDNAENWLTQAGNIGEKIENWRITSIANGYLGQYYEKQQEFFKALEMTRKALFFAQQGYYPEILYKWQWQMGRLLNRENDFEQAVKFYQSAIATLNPIRVEFFTGFKKPRKTFAQDIRPVYMGLAQMLIEHPEINSDVSDESEFLSAAGHTMEMLKKAELQDFYRDECLESLDTIETGTQIPAETAVIYPIPLPDYLSLLIMFSDSIKTIKVPVTAQKIEQSAKKLRHSLESWKDDYKEDAMHLYDWLIRPALPEFTSRNIQTLIIVPDSALSLLPFAALHSREHFLIQEYALGTVPSLDMTDTRQSNKDITQILLNGLSESREGFMPLKNVKNELESIENIIQSRVFIDQDFTKENIENEMEKQDYDVVHMATHAVFGDSPEDTFLLTYDDRLTLNNLDQIIGMKKYQGAQLDLLTLSACETAAGDERAAFGLAGVAIRAGAKSALATLWKVDDAATSRIIEEFYRHYITEDISKAKALQIAQKKLIEQKEFEHPVFWAPFLLIGNWM